MNRRQFLRLSGAGLAAMGLSACSSRTGSTGSSLLSDVALPERFTAPLPAMTPAVETGGRLLLTARAGEVEVFPGHKTAVRGYDGIFPGPLVRARAGQELTLRVDNRLDAATVLHLHGGRTPPQHDGYPTDFVQPGEHRDYVFPLKQRAASLWYHDHTMDATGLNVYRGLAGMFLLEDPAEDELGLPAGDRDIPLLICDRAFDGDYQLKYPVSGPEAGPHGHGTGAHGTGDSVAAPQYLGGVLADVMLVNGAPWPVLEVDAARYRFRLLNASNARRLELAVDDGEFVQVGTDQGLLTEPITRRTITLAQAERVDAVIDFSGYDVGTRVRLRNLLGTDQMADVMEFVVARTASDDSRIPDVLSEYDAPTVDEVTIQRDFHFALAPVSVDYPHGRWTVNGVGFDSPEPVATLERGTVERWRFSTDVHHPVHMHLLQMHVLSHRGAPPGPAFAGIKDTVDLVPGDACEVLVRVEGYAGRYVMHCHNLEHEDMMMMVNVDIV